MTSFDVQDRAWAAVTEMRAEAGGWDSSAFRRAMHRRNLHVWTWHLDWWYRRSLVIAAPTWVWVLGGGALGSPVGVWIGTR